ncbi:Hexokinase [Trichuris suis]|nr:Hexokinase [Trichuris suis]
MANVDSMFQLESVLSEFILDNESLRRMMYVLDKQMNSGLIGGLKDSTVAMLPSFVPRLPDGSESGTYLAIDLGGTNLRVLMMEINPGQESHAESRNFRMPQSAMTGTGEELFDFIATCMANFLEEKGLLDTQMDLGFTFSYPCDQKNLRSAILLRWTKGFNASGVEGNDVVKILQKAIDKKVHLAAVGGKPFYLAYYFLQKLKVRVVALMNDTVGTQVATAHEMGQCALGVILATGTNASYLEDVKRIVKLKGVQYDYDKMIVDTEWGGFGDRGEAEFIKTQYDRIVDARSVHPGVQCFDKMVGGMYMGELVRLVVEKLVKGNILFKGVGSELLFTSGTFPTKYISEILCDEGGHLYQTRQILDELGVDSYGYSDLLVLREVCMTVSRRSANLCAAAIACVLNRISEKKVIVGIDGSTYRFHPFFHSWVKDKVRELVNPSVEAIHPCTGWRMSDVITSPESVTVPGRSDCAYCAGYCEENIHLLATTIRDRCGCYLPDGLFVVVISNPYKSVPIWKQRAGRPNREGLAVWDYHVILVDKVLHQEEVQVLDLDTTLSFPCSFDDYVQYALRDDLALSPQYKRLFHLIPAEFYYHNFASDRSHMRRSDGSWITPPPSWPPIQRGLAENSMPQLINLDAVGETPFGTVVDWNGFLSHFTNRPLG